MTTPEITNPPPPSPPPTNPQERPILDGPPAFILFGFIMLIAGYFRQLYSDIDRLIERLPPDASQRQDFVKALGWLETLTDVVLWGIFVLTLRILLYALSPLGVRWRPVKVGFDALFSLCLAAFIFFVILMHERAVHKWKEIPPELRYAPSSSR
jgi:hypothetical protein